jgi:hypothetical protein
MKKFLLLAAVTFALGSVPQAVACDFGAHAANATPVVVANATAEQTTQQPAAIPEPAAPNVVPDEQLAPSDTVADGSAAPTADK